MAGVASQDITDSRLANVPATQVTSSTRFNWSKQEVSAFETFIRENHITSASRKAADIQPLLSALHLDRFLSIKNTSGEPLRPIIEAKVRRKLASVTTSLNQEHHTGSVVAQGRTRLQAARTRAISAGEEPPTKLPQPDPIYTPEPWKHKARKKPTGSSTPRTVVVHTVGKAKEEVVRLELALTRARAKLSLLQQQEQQEQQAAALDSQLTQEESQQERQWRGPRRLPMRQEVRTISPKPSRSTPRPLNRTANPTPDIDSEPEPPSDGWHAGLSRTEPALQQLVDKTPHLRRLNTERFTSSSLSKRGQGENEDDSDAELSAHLEHLGAFLSNKYGTLAEGEKVKAKTLYPGLSESSARVKGKKDDG